MDKTDSPRVGDALFKDLVQKIFLGHLKPGTKLPTEMEMAKQYGLARGTVSEVISKLEALKVVKGRRGSGITVMDFRKTAGLGFAGALLQGEMEPSILMEIIDFRFYINIMHARESAMAMEKITMNDILTLEEIDQRVLDALDAGDLDSAVKAEEEYRSHTKAIVGNLFLILHENSIQPIVRPLIRLLFADTYGRVFVESRRKYFRAALVNKKTAYEYENEMIDFQKRVLEVQRQTIQNMLKNKEVRGDGRQNI